MKSLTAPLFLLFLLPALVFAQSPAQHPDDPLAELIGTYEFAIAPDALVSLSSIESQSGSENECNTGSLVYVWRTVGGRVDFILDATSITFSGPCCTADSMTTSRIFAQVSRTGLHQGILLGLSPCPASCATPATARVYTSACVQRTGSCTTTAFTPCDELLAYREYTYCCVNGVPMITELPGVAGSCMLPCESTTGGGGGSLE